jgi:23S rRNA (guanosine2251-2'-O)-methyltransferase
MAPPRRQPARRGRSPQPPPARPRPRSVDRGLGGDQVEGRQAVRELLAAGRRRVREVWFASDVEPAPILGEIEDLCQRRRVTLQRVARGRLESAARSEAPQGVLARAEPLREADFDELCRTADADGSPPFLVGLDGVTDPQNLGAVLRSAACAGATGVVLPRHRAVHVTPTVAKAAAGAIEHLPMAVVPGLPGALARARELGVWTVGLDATADRSVFDLDVATEAVLVVLGAEGAGLGRLTRERCDVVVAIPLRGPLDSLNVAAAAAVACFEIARRRRV